MTYEEKNRAIQQEIESIEKNWLSCVNEKEK